MSRREGSGRIAPPGLVVQRLDLSSELLTVIAHPRSKSAACPTCGELSRSVHSRYERVLADLPATAAA